ncbi:MAG: hypothetical protein WDO68_05595 [Gammaproteobacteria bacterium]
MIRSLAFRFARPLSIHRSLRTLARVSAHVLIISPSTEGSIAFARALGRTRPCLITRGPITATVSWPAADCLRTAAEISHAFVGHPTLPRTIISYPDQLPCVTSTSVMVPFLRELHAFSTLEALLVMRHKPRVFALSSVGGHCGFRLVEVHYNDAFDADGQILSLGNLVGRLLLWLATDLANPPPDWLAAPYLPLKSARVLWMQAREEMKDVECLLRMQLQSRFCDRERTGAALAAVVERQRILIGTSLP